ncbi:hypothetical protein [Shewanella cutis]|uniref:Uncharacterized protein n=1 Tax=Shewanella cutis TaxID=2766780 RepID=A0ABS9R093_9GAMM|nr:hypothetical protein [Shewanella sp. PS-2]MCG9966025.1 hypothetical protein [Shewanella sp. PS-2]
MARSKVVQVPCDADLYAKIVAYRDEKGLEKDAAAARDLILFALRILEHKDDAEGLSTRELLEVILTYTVKAQHTSSLVYYQTYNGAPVDIQSAGIKHKETMRKAEEKVEQILAGENKED